MKLKCSYIQDIQIQCSQRTHMCSLLHTHTHTHTHTHRERDSYSTVLFNCEWFGFLTPDRPSTPTPFLSAQFKSKQKKHLVSLSVWTTTAHSEDPRSTKRSVMTDCCVKMQPLARISTMIRITL